MRLNINHAGRIAILFSCALLLVRVQAQDSSVPTIRPVAPLRDGNDVTPPRATYMPDPEYSEEARETKLQGTCVLSLVVGADGKPRDIAVVRKLGMGLDEKAVEAVRAWTFEPGRKDRAPVAVQIQVEVSFSLGGKLSPEQLTQMSKANAEFQARMQVLVYRVSDDRAPRTCGISNADDKRRDGPTITIAKLGFEGDFRMPATERARVISRLISQ